MGGVERVEGAGNDGFKEVKFVSILRKWFCVVSDGLCGLLDMLVVKGFSDDGVFDGFGAPRDGSGGTENDADTLAASLFDFGGYSDFCEGPVGAFFVFLFEIEVAAAGGAGWDVDVGEDILRSKDVFVEKIFLRGDEEVFKREGLGLWWEGFGFDRRLSGAGGLRRVTEALRAIRGAAMPEG